MIALTSCASVNHFKNKFCFTPGEVRSSRVRAGSAEEDPVVWVPPEEAGRGALGSPALPRRQGGGSTHCYIPLCFHQNTYLKHYVTVWGCSSVSLSHCIVVGRSCREASVPSDLSLSSYLNSGWALRSWKAVPVLPVSGRLRELWTGQNSKVSMNQWHNDVTLTRIES